MGPGDITGGQGVISLLVKPGFLFQRVQGLGENAIWAILLLVGQGLAPAGSPSNVGAPCADGRGLHVGGPLGPATAALSLHSEFPGQ